MRNSLLNPDRLASLFMRIVRFQSNGKIHIGRQIDDQTALRIEGDLFGPYRVTDETLKIEKLLAPKLVTGPNASIRPQSSAKFDVG